MVAWSKKKKNEIMKNNRQPEVIGSLKTISKNASYQPDLYNSRVPTPCFLIIIFKKIVLQSNIRCFVHYTDISGFRPFESQKLILLIFFDK